MLRWFLILGAVAVIAMTAGYLITGGADMGNMGH